MRRVDEPIEKHDPREVLRSPDRILDRDWEHWARQIEREAAEGRLSSLFARALQDHRKDKSRSF